LDPLVLTRSHRRTQPVLAPGALGAAAALVLGLALAGCGQVPGSAAGAGAGASGGAPGPVAVPTADLASALGCPDDTPVAVAQRLDLPTSTPAAVLVAHCASPAGSPPDGVYVVSRTGGSARVTGTLVAANAQVDVSRVVRTGDRVQVTGRGYSGPDVPRCCPDVPVSRSWQLVGDRLVPAS
jgi:hypothetical protein